MKLSHNILSHMYTSRLPTFLGRVFLTFLENDFFFEIVKQEMKLSHNILSHTYTSRLPTFMGRVLLTIWENDFVFEY